MLQLGHLLQFNCLACESLVSFSVLQRDEEVITCSHCQKKYLFDDDLLSQLKQFEALCRQIHASEKILGNTSIAIDMGSKQVKVPFNILLTRLDSVIELNIGGKMCSIAFRVDPLQL